MVPHPYDWGFRLCGKPFCPKEASAARKDRETACLNNNQVTSTYIPICLYTMYVMVVTWRPLRKIKERLKSRPGDVNCVQVQIFMFQGLLSRPFALQNLTPKKCSISKNSKGSGLSRIYELKSNSNYRTTFALPLYSAVGVYMLVTLKLRQMLP